MNSGILRHNLRPRPDEQEALYAELRSRALRKEDWRRIKRMSFVLLVAAALGIVFAYIRQFGFTLPPGISP